jgi:hypothetical protein
MIFVVRNYYNGGEKLLHEKLTKKVGWRSLWIGCEDLWKTKMQLERCVHEISWWLVVVTKKVIWEIFLTLVGMLQGFWEKLFFYCKVTKN